MFPILTQFHLWGYTIPIYTYGLMLASGYVLATILAVYRGKTLGFSKEFVLDLGTFVILGAILGARFFYITYYHNTFKWDIFNILEPRFLVHSLLTPFLFLSLLLVLTFFYIQGQFRMLRRVPTLFLRGLILLGVCFVLTRILFVMIHYREYHFGIFAVWEGGIIFYGGLVGGIATGIYYVKKMRAPLWKVADLIIPVLFLAVSFGRIGCFSRGCCFGAVTHSSLSVQYPRVVQGILSPACYRQTELGLISPWVEKSLPVYPIQLYDSALNLLTFLFLWFFWKRRRFEGEIFSLGLLFYSVERFGTESFRGDMGRLAGLTVAQYVSIPIAIAGLFLYFYFRRRNLTPPSSPSNGTKKKGHTTPGAEHL